MASAANNTKRKTKAYYRDFSKKNRYGILRVGIKGVLITCNGNEKQCIKEAYNLLNEYADNLYGPEFQIFNDLKTDISEEDQLEKEVNILKTEKKQRRFQQLGTKVKNILFIETKIPDPCQLISAIFKDVSTTGQKKSRFILKMIPVLATCKCTPEDFKKCLTNIINEKYSDTDLTLSYRINCKVRNNSSADKSDFIWYSRELIGNIRKNWLAKLESANIIIDINILQSICCVSLLDCYEDFKKYNLSVIVPFLPMFSKKRNIDSTNDNPSKVIKSVKEANQLQSKCSSLEKTNVENCDKNNSSLIQCPQTLDCTLEEDNLDIDVFSGT